MNNNELIKHVIYHIPGQKVGCTSNFEQRKEKYPENTIFEILEELICTPNDAGDKEWEWAAKFGYKKGSHYGKSSWNVTMNSQIRTINGKKAAINTFTPEHQKRIAGLGGKSGGKRGALNSNQKDYQCPHCNKIGKSNAMARWHFENCKHKL
jgi:hypothetical protein